MEKVRNWLKEEDGFIVFETFGLMLLGVILAIIIALFVLAIAAIEYTRVENEFIGSEAEANDALQRFSP